MAWPDFPPSEQIAAYESGLSGATASWAPMDREGNYSADTEPVEYYDDSFGTFTLKAGYYYRLELDAWLAGPAPDPDPEPEPETSALALAVAKFLDGDDDPDLVALAEEHSAVMVALVRAYTRGRGFDTEGAPLDDVHAVILTATARLVANPEQVDAYTGGAGVRGGFVGFSLPEQIVLNTYRRRSA